MNDYNKMILDQAFYLDKEVHLRVVMCWEGGVHITSDDLEVMRLVWEAGSGKLVHDSAVKSLYQQVQTLTRGFQYDVFIKGYELRVTLAEDRTFTRYLNDVSYLFLNVESMGAILNPESLTSTAMVGAYSEEVMEVYNIMHYLTANELVPPSATVHVKEGILEVRHLGQILTKQTLSQGLQELGGLLTC